MSRTDCEAPPCSYDCPHISACATRDMICRTFRDYVIANDPGKARMAWTWPRKPSMPYTILSRWGQ